MPFAVTPIRSQVDTPPYHTISTLRTLSDADFAVLWDAIPTDRQQYYQRVYSAELHRERANGSDLVEYETLTRLIKRYDESGLIPLGEYWLATPERIQKIAQDVDSAEESKTGASPAVPKRFSPPMLLGAAALAAVLVLFAGSRLFRAGVPNTAVAVVRTSTITPTLKVSVTPVLTPTQTPLALENQDAIIRGSTDKSFNAIAAYPISLRIFPETSSQPRLFVVQRKVIDTAEWQFDPNPDTASYIAGLSARPVIGIPYSEENAALFKAISTESTFTLQLNTGASLRFRFVSQLDVSRSDTSAFRQSGTGLVLALIGELDETGVPTATRQLITAEYWPEQEVSAAGSLLMQDGTPAPTVTPAPTATPVERLDVQVISVQTTSGYLKAQLRIINQRLSPVELGPDSVWLALGYAPQLKEPRVPAEGLVPFTLLPGQAVDLTVFFAYAGERFGVLGVDEAYRFSLAF